MSLRLEATEGPTQGETHTISGIAVIGRDPQSGIVISAQTVSREHAVVRPDDWRARLHDRGPRQPLRHVRERRPHAASGPARGRPVQIGPADLQALAARRRALGAGRSGERLEDDRRRRASRRSWLSTPCFGCFKDSGRGPDERRRAQLVPPLAAAAPSRRPEVAARPGPTLDTTPAPAAESLRPSGSRRSSSSRALSRRRTTRRGRREKSRGGSCRSSPRQARRRSSTPARAGEERPRGEDPRRPRGSRERARPGRRAVSRAT